jgi:hypothetical protein
MAALAIAAAGILSAWRAWGYGFGELARIGPGLVPFAVAAALAACGAALFIRKPDDVPRAETSSNPQTRVFTCVLGSLLAFAVLIRTLGFIPAAACAVVLASAARGRPRRSAFLLAAAVAVAGTLIFVHALGLNIPAISW